MQLSLIEKKELKAIKSRTHGGVSLKRRRKIKRPLIPGAVTHLVLKSSKAKGDLSFYRNKNLVNDLLRKLARKYFIELKDFVNMGNHLHLKVRFKDSKRFADFLRAFTGQLARKITGSNRGKKFGRFWDGLAFTRVITSKIEELGLKIYFEGNHRERELGQKAREEYLSNWNRFIYRLRKVRAISASG